MSTEIVSWNVNGIRAVYRKGAFDWLLKESPDIFCLQETKAEAEQLDDDLRNPDGYHSYFAHSKGRKGYSGVAIYSKVEPEKVKEGLGIEEFDQEGRLLTAYYKDFVLVNVYFPNGGRGKERLKHKLGYYDHFLKHVEKLKKKQPNIIFCGDVNAAHTAIDLARPKQNVNNTGFLPEERAWIDEVLNSGYVDVWRELNPEKEEMYTYWDMKTRSRDRNVGWRIDYFFASQSVMPKVKDASIHSSVMGSDHCPISLKVNLGQ